MLALLELLLELCCLRYMGLVKLIHCMYVLIVHLIAKTLTELIKLLNNILFLYLKCLDLLLLAFNFLNCFIKFELVIKTLRFQVLS